MSKPNNPQDHDHTDYGLAILAVFAGVLLMVFGIDCTNKEQDDRIDTLSTQIAQMEAQK